LIAIVERSTVETKITESLGQRYDHWSVKASLYPDAGWVITLTHPASAGLIIETGSTDEDEAVAVGGRTLAASTEIDIASAAPDLAHADLISGLRTLAKAFEWDSREVRAVAFLMFEHNHLSLDETAWLAGYEGIDAPMRAVSPLD
jgi:hypothetical protein